MLQQQLSVLAVPLGEHEHVLQRSLPYQVVCVGDQMH